MNAMYSADQINVPAELGTIMKQYAKAVMRDKPTDLYKYSANFFAIMSGYAAPFDAEGQLLDVGGKGTAAVSGGRAAAVAAMPQEGEAEAVEPVDALLRRYDSTGTGFMDASELPQLLADLKATLSLDDKDLDSAEEIRAALPSPDGQVDLLELRAYLFEGDNE